MRGERGFFLFIIACLVFAAFVWMAMRPEYPNLPSDEYKQAEETKYSPGSPACYPSRLETLPEREAADERYRCETQADKHRLQGNDLIQQTRSADASVAAVSLTYRQLLIELAGAIFGSLTLLAAGYAAWYARHAAAAGAESNKIATETAQRQLRAYMGINSYDLTPYDIGAFNSGRFMISMQNFGQTPAIALITQVSYAVTEWIDRDTVPEAWDYESGRFAIDVAPGAPMFREINFSEHAAPAMVELQTGASALWVKFDVSYEDIFRRRHEQTTFFYSRRHSYRSGMLLPCRQSRETTEEA